MIKEKAIEKIAEKIKAEKLNKEKVAEKLKIEKKVEKTSEKKIETQCYNKDRVLCKNALGFARVTAEYDNRGKEVEVAYYSGSNQKLCMSGYGYAKIIRKYDERGNVVSVESYGPDGLLCLGKQNFAKVFREYDERGNIVLESYFNEYGQACESSEGVHAQSLKYDNRDRLIERCGLGFKGEKKNNSTGYCSIKYSYDNWDRITELSIFNDKDRPVMPLGYHIQKAYYNEDNNMVRYENYGTNLNLISNTCIIAVAESCSGIAEEQKVEIGSILLKCNEWTIGDNKNNLVEILPLRNQEKRYVMLTPSGELKTYLIESGLFGVRFGEQAIEVSQVNEWKKKFHLEEL